MNLWSALRSRVALLAPLDRDPLARRDPAFIDQELQWLGPLTDAWYRPRIEGLEHIPDGPSLIVGMHNGGTMSPDMFTTMVAFWRRFGSARPAYGLAHDDVFRSRPLAAWLGKLGAVPAHQRNARALVERGASVLVYPGGDLDAFKPWRERHRVKFGERVGFVRTALATGVPIVPVVSVGAHETIAVLTDGQRIVRALGLSALTRAKVMPVMLCLPWGVWVGPWEAHLPMPSALHIRVLPPLKVELPPSAIDDERALATVRDQVQAAMQAEVDRLVAAGGFGVRARLRQLIG